MRFLGITKNPDSGNTALSQPGRHSGGAKPLKRQYFRSKTNFFFALNFWQVFFTFFHSVNPSWVQRLE